ncbi:MAG TPA: ornithine--oxo-acid transaminase [Actinomycetota bacterium]|nr:ornithine--oxo-acid transaminase [Actinomycetota bacterium]
MEGSRTAELLELAERHAARNYHPLQVVIAEAEGAWVTDVEGARYLDMLSAYSALNFGHRHPRLVAAAHRQLDRLTLTSRAFHNDTFPVFCRDLAELAGKDLVLTMNTGAEAVETAIKTARRWGYDVKGVAPDRAKIVVADGNFHGRTVTIVSFSTDPSAREGFGPFTPGFASVPYGDVDALREAIDDDTVGFLIEPIQGEAGVVIPPDGYLRTARELCTERGILLMADEIQSGLGRTGTTFACEHEDVVPDVYILGKALGGGIMPLSAVVADREVLGVFKPGEHGSTFGGNPLACAIGIEVIDLLRTGEYQARSAELGAWLLGALREAALPTVTEIRGRGLWFGIDVTPGAGTARAACERLMERGILAKDTHEQTIRVAPPLVISQSDLEWALERIVDVLATATT